MFERLLRPLVLLTLAGISHFVTASDVVTCSASSPSVRKDGMEPSWFTISRTGTVGPLTVQLTISGNASAGVDYLTLPTAVVIPNGLTSVRVPFVPFQDTLSEVGEVVAISIKSNAAYAVGAPATASKTIIDDDFPTVSLSTSGTLEFSRNSQVSHLVVYQRDNG